MAKRRISKKSKPGEPIYVTKRQLCNYMDAHKGNLSTRDYEKFKRMELVDSPVRDALWELRSYSDETLLGINNLPATLGRGKRVFAHFDGEDDTWYHFSLSYIPRVLNNRDVNDAIVALYFVRKWRVMKRSLWAEPEDVTRYGDDFWLF